MAVRRQVPVAGARRARALERRAIRIEAKRLGDRKVIAFALETSDGPQRAAAKLVRKNADWIVLNGASALNAPGSSVTLLDASGALWSAEGRPKAETAARLVELLGPAQSSRS